MLTEQCFLYFLYKIEIITIFYLICIQHELYPITSRKRFSFSELNQNTHSKSLILMGWHTQACSSSMLQRWNVLPHMNFHFLQQTRACLHTIIICVTMSLMMFAKYKLICEKSSKCKVIYALSMCIY